MIPRPLLLATLTGLLAPLATAQTPSLVGAPQQRLQEGTDGNFRMAQAVSRIAFGSCAKESREQGIWSQVVKEQPDLWIWAGDNIYGDSEDMAVIAGKYRQQAAQPGYQQLIQQVPVLATWDDHDYGVNDGGADYPMRRESQQLFLDVFGVAEDSPRRQREGVYHAATFGDAGQRVQVILLDTRYHRSPLQRFVDRRGKQGAYLPVWNGNATMLGEAQWEWLGRQLQQPADLRVIVSSIQFVSEEHRFEKWANLPGERARMLALLDRVAPGPLLFVSGDRHHAELSRLHREGRPPIYDLTASGINQSNRARQWTPPEDNAHRLGGVVRGYHFGVLEIDWNTRSVTMDIVMEDGQRRIQERVSLAELAGDVVGLGFGDAPTPEPGSLVIDGDFDDANGGLVGLTGKHLVFRFDAPSDRTIGSADQVTEIGIDLDGNRDSGLAPGFMGGTELQIAFAESTRKGEERRFYQPRITVAGPGGQRQHVPLAQLQIDIQPSYASRRFEMRLDRARVEALAGAKIGGEFRAMVATRGDDPSQATSVYNMSTAGEEVPPTADMASPRGLPTKPEGVIRVMSWNVLWSQPQENPKAFARIFQAVQPDVVLIQEWSRKAYDEAAITGWFRGNVDRRVDWQAMVTKAPDFGQGTAVVTPYPITVRAPETIPVSFGRSNFPVRFAGAGIETPAGLFLAASVHLKSAGGLGKEEDGRRLTEVSRVNDVLVGMRVGLSPVATVVGGDFNMLGTPEVARILTQHLDNDRSGLCFAEPTHLGDPALVYTHGSGAPYKSRLDYISWSDSTAELVDAFILDTTIMSKGALKGAGLQQDDSLASDHLPLVMDIRPFGRVGGGR